MSAPRLRFDIRTATGAILIVLGVWAAAALTFHLVLARPEMQEYVELSEGSQETLDALREDERMAAEREAFLEALRRAEADLATLRGEVLSTRRERFVDVQREVERICRQFNIDVDSVSYSNPLLIEQGLDRAEMVVPLEGGYENLRRLLQAVEASEYFLVVERVALGESPDGGGATLQLNVTLATYFQLPEGIRRKAPTRRRA